MTPAINTAPTAPVDTAPVDTAPVDTAPVDTAPVDTAPVDTAPPGADRTCPAGERGLSLRRLYLLRVGYLVMGGGLAVFKWPAFITHDGPWPLWEGVVQCMLVAMSVLALLGLKYPVKMLPILLFESLWKLTWLAVIALPQLTGDGLDAATAHEFTKILWVVVILAVIPWGYVVRRYVAAPGDRWRSTSVARTDHRL